MHYVRLLYECRELLKEQYLTLPRPEPERQHLIDIRSGKYTQSAVFETGRELAAECEALLAASRYQRPSIVTTCRGSSPEPTDRIGRA